MDADGKDRGMHVSKSVADKRAPESVRLHGLIIYALKIT